MSVTQIKDGDLPAGGGTGSQLKVNADGSINVIASGGGGVGSNVTIVEGGNTAVVTSGGALLTTTTLSGPVTTQESGLTDFKTSQYTVGTSEIQLTPTPLTNRSSISFKVKTTDATQGVFYSQSPGAVATTGYLLDDGESMQMDLTPSGTIYVVATAPGQKIYVVEIA